MSEITKIQERLAEIKLACDRIEDNVDGSYVFTKLKVGEQVFVKNYKGVMEGDSVNVVGIGTAVGPVIVPTNYPCQIYYPPGLRAGMMTGVTLDMATGRGLSIYELLAVFFKLDRNSPNPLGVVLTTVATVTGTAG